MILSVTAQKGGVGKTTLSTNLASRLHSKGYKTLAIDLDAQIDMTLQLLKERPEENTPTIFDVLTGKANINDVIVHQSNECDLIQAHSMLYNIDSFVNATNKNTILKRVLKQLKTKYDYIIIDNPPNLSTLTINVLACCDKVLMPIQADYYSCVAIQDFYKDTFVTIKKELNPKIKLLGFVLMKYYERAILSRQVRKKLQGYAEELHTHLFDATIRNSITVNESQFEHKSIFDYAPKSKVAKDFENFVDEFLKLTENKKKGSNRK